MVGIWNSRRVLIGTVTGFSLTGIFIVLLSTCAFGPGLSPDSIGYMSAAENLNRGNGYLLFSGEPMTVWPPLFPTILAGLDRTRIGAASAARVLHALVFGCIIFLSGLLFSRHVPNRAVVLIGVAAMALSVPLLDSMVMIWSEPVFTLLILLAALAMERYLREAEWRYLAVIMVCLGLACLQRYTGLGILAAFAVGVVFMPPQVRAGSRILRSAALLVAALAPVAVWMFRNVAMDGTIMGPRIVRDWAIGSNLWTVTDFFSAWFLPSAIPVLIRIGLLAVVGVAIAALMKRVGSRRLFGPAQRDPFILFAAFVAAFYAVFLIFSTAGVKVDPLSSRMLGPVYPLAALTLLAISGAVLDNLNSRRVRTVVLAAMALWLLYPVAWTAHRIQRWMSDGIGYAGRSYQDPVLAEWLKDVALPQGSVTNDPEAVFYIARTWLPPVPLQPATSQLASGGYLVWFNNYFRTDLASPRQLAAYYKVVSVTSSDAAVIYRLEKP